jgi:hypothetical protein
VVIVCGTTESCHCRRHPCGGQTLLDKAAPDQQVGNKENRTKGARSNPGHHPRKEAEGRWIGATRPRSGLDCPQKVQESTAPGPGAAWERGSTEPDKAWPPAPAGPCLTAPPGGGKGGEEERGEEGRRRGRDPPGRRVGAAQEGVTGGGRNNGCYK